MSGRGIRNTCGRTLGVGGWHGRKHRYTNKKLTLFRRFASEKRPTSANRPSHANSYLTMANAFKTFESRIQKAERVNPSKEVMLMIYGEMSWAAGSGELSRQEFEQLQEMIGPWVMQYEEEMEEFILAEYEEA